ncbi:MAG TPA: sulfur carrier protein ThiS [Candidatus Hydrogenedentes bacterium]|nr:sulfur carrier protein ThiS [Candidatus Hydrogenedentota bacterium]HRZ82893.1 sulfur carrier protein ThiS [Candidatus Hydrogenedentota bacterium]
MNTLAVTVNGERREAPAGATVQSLLESLALDPAHVVVERNGEILRRDDFASTPLAADDTLEIIRFVGGG